MSRPLPDQLREAAAYLHSEPGMHPLLIAAIQEAVVRIEGDKGRIAFLRGEVDRLKDALDDIAMTEFDDSSVSAGKMWERCCIMARKAFEREL